MSTVYKPIDNEFFGRGFIHRLIKRQGMVALFERWHRELPDGLHHFEVVRLRNSDAYVVAGVTIPAQETYPSSESWGTDGFTYSTRVHAEAKFASIA